jgi:hypothetical protein
MAQLASIDQQREIMRYMNALNGWLDRDVRDRQSELRGVTARVDQLREELERFAGGVRPQGRSSLPCVVSLLKINQPQ